MLTEALLAQICRATNEEAVDLALKLPPSDRAHLALLCNGRAHLRSNALAVAGLCSRDDLVRAGGIPGQILHEQSGRRFSADDDGSGGEKKQRISLARFAPYVPRDWTNVVEFA